MRGSMMKRFNRLMVLIVLLLIFLMLSGCRSGIKVTDEIKYADLKTVYQSVFDKLGLKSENLYIASINTEGFTIWINSSNDAIMEIMLETIHKNADKQYAPIINLNYKDSVFRQYHRGEYELSLDWQQSYKRMDIKEYVGFLSAFNFYTIMDEHKDVETDFFEIRTDGLFRKIENNDFVYNYSCYLYEAGSLTKIDEGKRNTLDPEGCYLPVYFSIGHIVDEDEGQLYKKDICAVVLIN